MCQINKLFPYLPAVKGKASFIRSCENHGIWARSASFRRVFVLILAPRRILWYDRDYPIKNGRCVNMRTKILSRGRREKTVMRKTARIGSEYTVEYRLTGTPLRPGREFGTAYTVYAAMRDNITGATETRYVFDFTRDLSFAVLVFRRISGGKVTPVTLFDVVSDAVTERYC